jgi:hypothetical protein
MSVPLLHSKTCSLASGSVCALAGDPVSERFGPRSTPIKTAFAESATTWHCVRAIVYKISDDLPQLTSRRRDKDAARRLASTATFERVMRPRKGVKWSPRAHLSQTL